MKIEVTDEFYLQMICSMIKTDVKFTIYNDVTRDSSNITSAIFPDGISVNLNTASTVFDCLSRSGEDIFGNKVLLMFFTALAKKYPEIARNLYLNNVRGKKNNPESYKSNKKALSDILKRYEVDIDKPNIKNFIR
jgi:hypothetical protein